jgi:hypothetical protein
MVEMFFDKDIPARLMCSRCGYTETNMVVNSYGAVICVDSKACDYRIAKNGKDDEVKF